MHGDFLTAQEVDKIVPESGISLSGYHDAISLALMNANYMNQKFVSNPDTIPVISAYADGVQIQLLNRMIKQLEYIAVATSSSVALQTDDQVDELVVKASAQNTR